MTVATEEGGQSTSAAASAVAAAAGVAGVQTTLVVQDGGGGGGACEVCCPCCYGPPGDRCTLAKTKTCLKVFLAQVFSQVGLCALVVGYAIMGAFIFQALESRNEVIIRQEVEQFRNDKLDELYNITGKTFQVDRI